MTREEYLRQLQHYLKRLPKEDYDSAMEYFTEYFEEAGPEGEQAVIAELGTPKQAASELLRNLLNEQIVQPRERRSVGAVLMIALLAICAAPIALPLAIAATAILFALVLVIASAVLCVLLLGVCGILVGGKLILIGLASAGSSVPGMCMLLGLGLLGIGLGILLSMVLIALCRMIGLLLLRLIQWILGRRKANR
ncbi:MAG: DUF1700 domain-containing protein [Clostridiales bacterium]|nr:DUF1700 domain-containing protein [Clostridiales bacterium]